MPPLPVTSPCTHDMGPGITICLRCRSEQRQAAIRKQQRVALVGGGVTIGLILVCLTTARAFFGGSGPEAQASPANPARVAVVQQGSPRPEPAADAPAVSLPTEPGAAPATVNDLPAILVAEGRSDLPDSVIAERAGDSVVVDFDRQDSRTRRRDKFERVVRQTLPRVYGASAASALAAIPEGALVTGDLLTELPVRGLHLPVAVGWTIDLWPQTRPGRDGPLVVSYRVKARRS